MEASSVTAYLFGVFEQDRRYLSSKAPREEDRDRSKEPPRLSERDGA